MDPVLGRKAGMSESLVAFAAASPVRLDQPYKALNDVFQFLKMELLLLMLEGLLLHSIDPAGHLLHYPNGFCQQGIVLVLPAGMLQQALNESVKKLKFKDRKHTDTASAVLKFDQKLHNKACIRKG